MGARIQKLRLVFAFMLGTAVTLVVMSAVWLEEGWCPGGKPCSGSERHLRRMLAVFSTESTLPVRYETTDLADTNRAQLLREKSWPFVSTSVHENSTDKQLLVAVYQQRHLDRSETPTVSKLWPSTDYPTISPTTHFTIPRLKISKRTFAVPPEAPSHVESMVKRLSGSCTDSGGLCYNKLTSMEQKRFSRCTRICLGKSHRFGSLSNGTCRFMSGKGRLPVALASFPGSGNTWTRGLLEKVTGVCTGSLYCDCGLRAAGFAGEGIQGSGIIAVKTHNLKIQLVGGHIFSKTRIPYGAAILIVRDPRSALIAEWNRERSKKLISPNVSNHYLFVGEEQFRENEKWDNYIRIKLPRWPLQMVNLLTEIKFSGRPVYILVFEDLKRDPVREMKKVTDFLGFQFTEEEVASQLGGGFSKFYRNHTADFSHFTPQQESYVHDIVQATSDFMKKNDIYNLFPRIDDYL